MSTIPNADDQIKALWIRLAAGHVVSAAIYAVLNLGIADRLAAGPRSIEVLAAETDSNQDALYRVLRALASVGVFVEQQPRTFALNRSAMLLRSSNSPLQSQLRWMAHPLQLQASAGIMHSMKTGAAAIEELAGRPLFQLLADDVELAGVFHNAMIGSTEDVMAGVLAAYDFSDIQVLVDVGGGHGQLVSLVLQKYPQMCGVLFDRLEVVAGATDYLRAAGVTSRCRIEPGSFFERLPKGDAYVLKHIIHDWDDVPARAILMKLREELEGQSNGRVLLIESPLSTGNRPDATKFADLSMLLSVGGRERTTDEYSALCASAGLELTRTVDCRSGVHILEARLG